MLSIHLHRHGETTWNEQQKIIGQSHDEGIDFTDLGLKQIRALVEQYRSTNISAVYTSDLKRARLTAETIASQLALPLQLSSQLRALNMGIYQGRPAHEFRSDPMVLACFTDFTRKIPSGESIAEFRERLLSFVESIADRHAHEQHILVISHSAAISNIKSLISGAAYTDVNDCHLSLEVTGLTVLETSEAGVA